MYHVYTDGAARINDKTGPCAWAFVVYDPTGKYKGHQKDIINPGTNNIGELTAIIKAMEWANRHNLVMTVYTDSAYCKNGLESWMHGWATKGWKKSDGSIVENVELWKHAHSIYDPARVTLVKVKGHSGVEGNEKADNFCNIALNDFELNTYF